MLTQHVFVNLGDLSDLDVESIRTAMRADLRSIASDNPGGFR